MNDDSPMPFGKHKGTPMGKVPAEYLDWLIGQKWVNEWPDVRDYILNNKKAIDQELDDE